MKGVWNGFLRKCTKLRIQGLDIRDFADQHGCPLCSGAARAVFFAQVQPGILGMRVLHHIKAFLTMCRNGAGAGPLLQPSGPLIRCRAGDGALTTPRIRQLACFNPRSRASRAQLPVFSMLRILHSHAARCYELRRPDKAISGFIPEMSGARIPPGPRFPCGSFCRFLLSICFLAARDAGLA